jgi:hypothetical protein
VDDGQGCIKQQYFSLYRFFSLFHGHIKVEIVYSTTKGGEPGNKTVEQSI